jgi:NAD kinase
VDYRDRVVVKLDNEEGNQIKDMYIGAELSKTVKMDIKDFHILNEVTIDRGPLPYCVNLDIFIDNVFLTNLVGDGILISTPTGSTAYNLAAGGSLSYTNVPIIMITPISPHSLSFRPLILPLNATIKIKSSSG